MSGGFGCSKQMSKKCRTSAGAPNKCQKNAGRARAPPKNVRKRPGGTGRPKRTPAKGRAGPGAPKTGQDKGSQAHTPRTKGPRKGRPHLYPHISNHYSHKWPIRKQHESQMICMYGYAAHTNDANPMARSNWGQGAGVRDRAANSCGAAGPSRSKVYILIHLYICICTHT